MAARPSRRFALTLLGDCLRAGAPNEAAAAKLIDLQMLVSAGGRERTRDEYAALFAAAGFRLAGVRPTAGGLSVTEGVPA